MNKLDTILFDLDGTLLPMDQDQFVRTYLHALAEKFAPEGFDPQQLVGAVWKGTEAMVKNDGTMTNHHRFWSTFSEIMGTDMAEKEAHFEMFYRNEFEKAKTETHLQPLAEKTIDCLRAKGYRLILATNPLFPQVATHKRMNWAGISREAFSLVTTYEEERYCKPNPKYYESILERFGLEPQQCMMVGNDVDEDMAALSLGISGYLLTDCLINRKDRDLSTFVKGSFEEFYEFAENLPDLNP